MATTQAREFFARALRAYQEQRYDAAKKHCHKVLKADPDFFEALHLRGVLLLNGGEWQAAAASLSRACELQPRHAEVHVQLGLALQQLGKLEEARAALAQALAIDPRQPHILCRLGKICVDQGRFDEAFDAFAQAQRLAPAEPSIHYFLGQTEYCRGNYQSAVDYLQAARRLDPAHAFTGVVLGRAYTALGSTEEAIAAYRQAIATDARCYGAYLNLGNLLGDQGRQPEAIAVFEDGIRQNPGAVELLCALAEEYERANRLDDAGATVKRALAVASADPHANLIAARLERRAGHYDAAAARLRRLETVSVDPARAIEIRFELGDLADRSENPDKAFDYFAQANRLQFDQAADAEPRRQNYLNEIAALRGRFTADWVSTWRANDVPAADCTPVFLVGFPRSGTTLLDTMLHGHPRVTVMEEAATTLRLREGAERLAGGYPASLAACDEDGINRLRQTYFDEALKHGYTDTGKLVIDKMPMALVHAGLIHRVFPRARFIFAVRHPCDVVLSCFMRHFEMNALGVNLCDLEHIVTLYEQAMDLWQAYQKLLPLQCHRVRYEDVLADTPAELRRLCDFLGLEWHDAMLDNVQLAKGRGKINTPSYQQVAEPIYTRARYRWQRYRDRLAPVEARLQRSTDLFGYGTMDSG